MRGACRRAAARFERAPAPGADAHAHPHGGPTFVWLAAALSLAAFIASAVAAHLIGLLTATGLAARDAVLVGSLIGPMQVAGRIMEFAFNRHVRALAMGTFAFALMAAALALFTQVRGVWIVALAFAIAYGWANGIMTIVRGTVPAELFGHREYGALLGRLALPQFVLKAVAPFALTLLFLVDPARDAVAVRAAGARASSRWSPMAPPSRRRGGAGRPRRRRSPNEAPRRKGDLIRLGCAGTITRVIASGRGAHCRPVRDDLSCRGIAGSGAVLTSHRACSAVRRREPTS